MDGRGSISFNAEQRAVPTTITTALASAVLEWFLIFLLFIDAGFSYLVTKFACYNELQIPCLLCSRLDHVLGKDKAGFYWDLICNKHKLKISSLVLCKLHNNLVDVHKVCENCLFSFATVNKSNAETYRWLVGKLGDEPHIGHDHDLLIADRSLSKCSCCNEKWISTGQTRMLFLTKSIGYEADDLDASILATNIHGRYEGEGTRDFSSQKTRTCNTEKKSVDPLLHVEYEKVKMTSDTESEAESEASVSDDESATNLFCVTEQGKKDLVADYKEQDLPVDFLASEKSVDPDAASEPSSLLKSEVQRKKDLVADDDSATNLFCVTEQGKKDLVADYKEQDLPVDLLASEKLIDPDAASEPSSLVKSEVQVEASHSHCTASGATIGHVLEELNRQYVEQKTPSELISSIEVIPSSEVIESSMDESRDKLDAVGVAESGEAVKDSCEMAELPSNSISTNEKQSDLKSGTNDTVCQLPSSLELGDAYKLAIGSRGRQLSGKLLDQKSFKESTRMSEDLKLLLSQLSAARGIEVPLYDISPRVSGSIDDFKTSDTCSSVGIQILQRRISLDRNESGISLDGSIVSEIEGESAVDRLKRQVEHDRKLMSALYKELEEERSASAVAANQAMAMITRLQEEKAAVHMEALQCVRMMEEQAEYDGEALQKANDLLTEKEREIQELESELEAYRKKLNDLPLSETVIGSNCGLNRGETMPKPADTGSTETNTSTCNSNSSMPDPCLETDKAAKITMDENINMKGSQLEFEEETLFILQCLRKLEKKLLLFSGNEALLDTANGDDLSLGEKVRLGNGEHPNGSNASPRNDETEVEGSPEHAMWNEGSISSPEISAGQYENSQKLCKGSGELKRGKRICENAELEALRNEFLVLSGRLDALEAEHSFLEHSINSLSRGDEGIKFIQEVAHQVRELHSIGIKRRN